jgi:hypothetical protein
MGAKFWTAAEDNYFWFTALPLSNYATGVNIKNSGLNWRELAVRMQIDLDAQNLSERQYAGPMLFQQWSRRFSALAEARGEASPLYLAGKAEREATEVEIDSDDDGDGDDEDSLPDIESPRGSDQEDKNGEILFLSPAEEEEEDEEDDNEEEEVEQEVEVEEKEEDEGQFNNVPANYKPAPVTPTSDRSMVQTLSTQNTKGKSVKEDSDVEEDEYQDQAIHNSATLHNAISIAHQMQILPSSTKASGNQRLLGNGKQVAQDLDVSMEEEINDDEDKDIRVPFLRKSAQVSPPQRKDTSMTSSQKRKGKEKQVMQISDEEADAYPLALSPVGPGNSKNKKQRL